MSKVSNNFSGQPLVSIGFPVYNRPKLLRRALECLTKQSFNNLQIIISDDCSPEKESQKIVQEFMERDPRIQYYRQVKNIGAINNHEFVLQKATGKYFMWAADDDLWRSDLITQLVGLLEATPSAVMAMCRTEKIDLNGRTLKLGPLYLTTTGMTRAERLRYFARDVSGWLFYGLCRTDIARMGASVFLDKRLAKGSPEVLFLHKCFDRGDLVFTERVLFLKSESAPYSQNGSDRTSLLGMWRELFWHCYGVFFKCYRLGGLSPWKVALVYWAIIQGLPQRSFFQHASRPLRRIVRFGAFLFKRLLQ